MSHYTTIQTELRDKDVILEALKLMGFSCEVGKNLPLHDFLGQKRTQTSDIIISRKELSSASNDIGLRRTSNGSYEMLISEFDERHAKTKDFLANLIYRYSFLKVKKELALSGFKIAEEKILQDNSIQIIAETQEA